MIVEQNHQLSGTYTVERVIRFLRPVFLIGSFQDFRNVVKGACGFSGGVYCHLIPVGTGQLADVWSSYIRRLCPDAVYVPANLLDLKAQLQRLTTGYVGGVDYSSPVTWGDSPSLHSLLEKRNPDGSPSVCGPSYLVDVERSSEDSPVSELQRVARFGIVPEIPLRNPSFLGVRKQLDELVHTRPPAPGQGLPAWLLEIPQPDLHKAPPPYLAQGGAIHSAITLTDAGISPGVQSYPPERRDSACSLANKLVVVGDGQSLEDACLFWNLRANRWPEPLPAWVTPEQTDHADVRRAIANAALHTWKGPGPPTDGVDDLHLVSATLDTKEIARKFLGDIRAVGWAPTEWIRFIDRRHSRFFGRSREAMTFSDGGASFVIGEDELPCAKPTQITVDIEIETFRPPPTRLWVSGTNFPRIGRSGETVIGLNYWSTRGSGEGVSLGYPTTFDIVKQACEEVGLRPTFDRKAALTYGLQRVLANDHGAHMILRNYAVLDSLKTTIESERVSVEKLRYTTPKGTPFGAFHRKLGSQQRASALVSWLLRKSLLFRGLELDCRNCGTNAWYSLDDIGNQFRCVGCQGHQPFDRMPHDASWRYRVNQMLASALDQGLLQQLLAAHDMDLRNRSRSRSYVFPNVILVDMDTSEHVAEIDLFGFQDGEWLAVECKARTDATESELVAIRDILNRLGGGCLQLVRASTASEEQDELVDRVEFWDHNPIRGGPVDQEQLWEYLDAIHDLGQQ